ncbi:MAG TPA: serine protease [bacterium]
MIVRARVRRAAAAGTLVVALALLAAGPSHADIGRDVTDRAIVAIGVAHRPSNFYVTNGTAFHVGMGYFYTNAHVVHSFRQSIANGYEWIVLQAIRTGIPDTQLGVGELTCVDSRWAAPGNGSVQPFDAALVRITRLLGPPMPPALAIAPAAAAVGDKVRSIGFPGATETIVRYEMRGDVVDVTTPWVIVQVTSGAVIPGSSGSPILNSDGEVVGIVSGVNAGRGLVVGVPIKTAMEGCALPGR